MTSWRPVTSQRDVTWRLDVREKGPRCRFTVMAYDVMLWRLATSRHDVMVRLISDESTVKEGTTREGRQRSGVFILRVNIPEIKIGKTSKNSFPSTLRRFHFYKAQFQLIRGSVDHRIYWAASHKKVLNVLSRCHTKRRKDARGFLDYFWNLNYFFCHTKRRAGVTPPILWMP